LIQIFEKIFCFFIFSNPLYFSTILIYFLFLWVRIIVATAAAISTADLSTAARQAEIIARDGNYGMILDIRPADGLITVYAQSDEGSMQTEIQAEVTGKPLRLMVNINYLKDFLTAVNKSPSITLQCNQPNTPVMLRPSDGAFDHVIMPMVLNH
jgi:DNA polymerase III sliding clamp (beta) subunit (PCNA family)